MTYQIKKIISKIEKYDYVSFDIFDTLIKRNVMNPTDIFDIVEMKYNQLMNSNLKNFKEKRLNAEIKAKEKAFNNEPNINDIYDNFDFDFDIQKIKTIEIETEIEFSQKNQYFYEIYKYCLENNKKVILISDMYLNYEYIYQILEKNEIGNFSNLFISCEYKASKKTGNLFSIVLEELKIKNTEIIHIGDSKKADFLAPRLLGISSVLIKRNYNNLNFRNLSYRSLENNILISYLNNNNNNSKNKGLYYKFGFELLGPLLFGYCNWLKKEFEEKKIEKVYFFAREGFLLKRVFDILNDNKTIKTKYLYVSRRSTRVPLLSDINNISDVYSVVKMRRIIDIESLFINVGLDINNYEQLLEKYNFKNETIITNNQNFELLFEELIEDIKNNAKEEETMFLNYLKQEEFTGKVGVVDVGWRGTMQDSISKILKNNKINCDILGFYLGTSPESMNLNCYDKMRDYFSVSDHYDYSLVRPFLNLLESLFLAQHGSTIGYNKENDLIIPKLDNYEYSIEEISMFKEIQNGAIDFITKYKYEIDINTSLDGMFRFGLYPKLSEIKMFENISYLETKKFLFVGDKNLVFYIFNPKQMYIDFCNCSWKIGFLKRLFVLKMDYFKLYKMLDDFSKKMKKIVRD